jgi:hypothetical protein
MKLLRAPVPVWLLVAALVVVAAAAFIAGRRRGEDNVSPSNAEATAASPTAVATDGTTVDQVRDAEYRTLARLRAGMTLAYFEEALGTPWFVTKSGDGAFIEHLFRGRDFWVQTVSDATGTVGRMAVTSCDPGFKPAFSGVPNSSPAIAGVVLNETHFDQTGAAPNKVHYFTSGATANSYYYDEYYFGNPGNYKTYYVGINDACPFDAPADLFVLNSNYRDAQFSSSDTLVSQFRAAAIANTYAETAVFVDQAEFDAFPIGASRILTRTAPPWTGP